MSTIFSWKVEEFEDLLASCELDPLMPYILKHFNPNTRILEAGCGAGRYVKYLYDGGYDITGVEYSAETVASVKNLWPELSVVQGDVLSLDYPDGHFSGIISIGVVEHFIEGPEGPLREMRRVLSPGGKALITVPCFNYIRRLKIPIRWIGSNLRRNAIVRKLFGRKTLPDSRWHRRGDVHRYHTYPEYGEFYEYRMTPSEFREALVSVGFSIVEDLPLYQVDGMFHEFGHLFARHEQWRFKVYPQGRILNWLLSMIPFFHNHMHLCVVTKEVGLNAPADVEAIAGFKKEECIGKFGE